MGSVIQLKKQINNSYFQLKNSVENKLMLSSKLCGYTKGTRDINLAACVELIHAATLMHDDVIDNGKFGVTTHLFWLAIIFLVGVLK